MISRESRKRIRELKRKARTEGLTRGEGYELEMLYGFKKRIKEDGEDVPYIILGLLTVAAVIIGSLMMMFVTGV